ncbi:helix-turn-helix domain-containing protein [Arthrobacter sp. C152]
MATNYTAVTTATNRNILLGILSKGTSKNATATKAGIPISTFNRKINNTGDFTLSELGKIAEALDLQLADILPAELIARDAA